MSNKALAAASRCALPRHDGALLHRLKAGQRFDGEPVVGQLVTREGLGHSSIWIRDSHMGCVWLGFLEELPQ